MLKIDTMVHVASSITLQASLEAAWALVRDFDAMPRWNDTVQSSRIEDGPADRVGCRRVLTFEDGGQWVHQLTGLSDEDHCLQYRIVGAPQPMRIPVWDYRATICVRRHPATTENSYVHSPGVAPQRCEITWSADFETTEVAAMQARATEVFERGFAGLRKALENPSSAASGKP